MSSLCRSVLTATVLLLVSACGGGGGGSGDPDLPGPPPDPGPQLGPDVLLSSDTPGRELSLVPDLCCDGERIYAVWYDRRDGNLDVYFNRSLDGGASWLPTDRRLDTDAAGAAGSLIPRICCDGLAVYAVWYDERSGRPDIHFNRSLDGGATWLASDVRINRDVPGQAQAREPQIACDGSNVYVCWYDDRDGSFGIWFNRSSDGGSTWLAQDVRLDGATPGQTDAVLPCLVAEGALVHVVWTDARNGGSDIYWTRSLDGGVTWLADDVRLNETARTTGAAAAPSLALQGDHVAVAWQDARDGLRDIYVNRSLDGGATWLASEARVDRDTAGAGDSIAPALCLRDGAAHLVWEDHRGPAPTILFSTSADAGVTWSLFETPLDTAQNAFAAAIRPSLRCCADGSLVSVWRDDRDGRFDVRLTRSTDRGATWVQPELRMDTDDPGAGHSLDPALCCAGTTAYVVWYDQRHGPGDVYFNSVSFDSRR